MTPRPPAGKPATATEYAAWFRALADPTQIQIVSLLARHGAPMNVGEIVAAVDVGQSTVSAHLKIRAEVRFLLTDRQGTSAYYRINDACVKCFPTAADIVMGKPRLPARPRRLRARIIPVNEPATTDAIVSRYSGLARAALAGQPITDGDPDPAGNGCFGAAAYAGDTAAPDGALRASLGCGNPLAVAGLRLCPTVMSTSSPTTPPAPRNALKLNTTLDAWPEPSPGPNTSTCSPPPDSPASRSPPPTRPETACTQRSSRPSDHRPPPSDRRGRPGRPRCRVKANGVRREGRCGPARSHRPATARGPAAPRR